MNNNKIITHDEVENVLANLSFYLKISILHKGYGRYIKNLKNILFIIEKWIVGYGKDNNLNRINGRDIEIINENLSTIPLVYKKNYPDLNKIIIFTDKMLYYARRPIDKEFNEKEYSDIRALDAINRLYFLLNILCCEYENDEDIEIFEKIYKDLKEIKFNIDNNKSLDKTKITRLVTKLKEMGMKHSIDVLYNCAEIIKKEYL